LIRKGDPEEAVKNPMYNDKVYDKRAIRLLGSLYADNLALGL